MTLSMGNAFVTFAVRVAPPEHLDLVYSRRACTGRPVQEQLYGI
jgi:hypothetical protein